MVDVYVGLGSNIEPEVHVRRAVADLVRDFADTACSSVYLSPPHGFRGDDFMNLVARFRSDAGPRHVEDILTSIEIDSGRNRQRLRTGPRSLDLDLLLYGERVDAAHRLPRDDILKYPFALAPLAELAPGLIHPVTGRAIGEAWRSMAEQKPKLERLGDTDWLA